MLRCLIIGIVSLLAVVGCGSTPDTPTKVVEDNKPRNAMTATAVTISNATAVAYERTDRATRIEKAYGDWEPFTVSDIHTNYVVGPTTADSKYRYRLIIILGVVKSVGKDHIYLTYPGLYEHQDYEIKAYLWSEEQIQKAQGLKPYDPIAMRCLGDGREADTTVVFVDCGGIEVIELD